ncbi:Placenta-specific protein 9 [Collichthys lucidus]|uniref:Placenta-specific protein 9 n=1 Tax=Collichthys lucidus TaxID=240159 RepID=A0A4U5VBP0_COLLU|nr:Placenta-specific protein 9 [Collichthys lucidus]
MTRPFASSVGLIFLLIGYTAAGPDSDLRPRAVRSTVCQEHVNLHTRLDGVEKKVEDTVENLETELAALLDAIEDPKWRPLLDNTGQKTVGYPQGPRAEGPVLN